MPIDIQLLQRYQLRTITDNANILELPVIKLNPIGDNLPHIMHIAWFVTGTPEELAVKIQSVYKELSSDFDVPIPLFDSDELKHDICRLNQPLPANVNCTLKVCVKYCDSDFQNNPDLSTAKEITGECYLWYQTEQSPFPGWLAIDFGTSNSTVTLFDPKVVPYVNGLPKEQEKRLRSGLAQWLSETSEYALSGINLSGWQKFVDIISKNLGIDNSSISDLFLEEDDSLLWNAIRQIETTIVTQSEEFRRGAFKQLNQIYHEAFRILPLELQSLIPIELDAIRRLREIPSELEIVSLEPLKVLMGMRAIQNKNQSISNATSTNWDEIKEKFHHSPKRYLGQNRSIKVCLNGKTEDITANRLTQAAWNHLIQLTEEYSQRNKDIFSEGNFKTAVVTYPTIAPPVVRREIEQMVSDLGFEYVQTSYDEAVSVAIFFLWREFGGDLNIGAESFKTRCRRYGDKWIQNVLVLDIGGGTTDLALIRLTLEEIDPFKENEDRGKGGRYYKLTPEILGSSGHLQLGGELITLRMFLLLKAAIADCLFTAVSEGNLQSNIIENRLTELNEQFSSQGKFISGAILNCVDKKNAENDNVAYKQALDVAEKIIPTRWNTDPSRLGTFYKLWEYAEEAKIALGNKSHSKDSLSSVFVFSWEKINELLKRSQIEVRPQNPESLGITLTSQQFERVVAPVMEEVIGITTGLIESRLGDEDTNSFVQEEGKSNKNYVDWLILSGKTCNLYQVEREIYREFSTSKYFAWNPERITFVPEYSKIATSAGACYAEKLRRLIFDPEAAKELLRKGANQLYIDVKNLFYSLPCSFLLTTQGGEQPLTIFQNRQELSQIDGNSLLAKARSQRLGVPLSIFVQRQDFKAMRRQLWGSFDCQTLALQLKMSEFEFRSQITAQFEVDQKLEFSLLFCRNNPYRFISTKIPSIDLKSAISKNSSEEKTQAVFDDNGQLLCNIAINVAESATVHNTDAYTLVFEAFKDYSNSLEVFRYEDEVKPQEGRGLISKPLPAFPLSGKHTFYLQYPQTKQWIRIGELSRPNNQTEYPCKYYAALDEQGKLRLYAGELPYWTSDNPNCLLEEGCVFQTELQLQPRDVNEKRDPFCGKH